MKNSPWFHQRRSESAPPTQRAKEPPAISQKQQDDIVERLSRPTESARYRKSLYWKLDGYMDKGFHSWSKMELFEDCKQCMWTPNGTIKKSCKIRPINYVLPPLRSSGNSVSHSVDNNKTGEESTKTGGVNFSMGLERQRSNPSRGESRRSSLRPRPSATGACDRFKSNLASVVPVPVRLSQHSSSSGRSFQIPSHHRSGGFSSNMSALSSSQGNNMAVPRVIAATAQSFTPVAGH